VWRARAREHRGWAKEVDRGGARMQAMAGAGARASAASGGAEVPSVGRAGVVGGRVLAVHVLVWALVLV
jgi:hypothetical protein